jgi:hypothetical protein
MGNWYDFAYTKDKGILGTGVMGRGGALGTGVLSIGDRATDAPISTADAQADREEARRLYERLLSERGQALPQAPQVSAGAPVELQDIGPVERVAASRVGPAPQATSFSIAPTERVQARDVQAPTAQGALTAGFERVAGAQINDSAGQQVRGMQMGQLGMLQDAAEGRGPSVAGAEFDSKIKAVSDEQLALAASARGNEGAFARRQAARDIARIKADAAKDFGVARATEMVGSRAALGAALAGVRGADTATAVEQARLNQGANLQTQQIGADVAKFNAAEGNQQGRFYDSLRTTVDQANADRGLTAATTNATLGQQRSIAQAGQDTTVSVGNADRTMQGKVADAQLEQQAGITNAGAANQRPCAVPGHGLQRARRPGDRLGPEPDPFS